jgi:cytochrome oxidase Cu insertion factor (SCO1/SenC/PrrC family)
MLRRALLFAPALLLAQFAYGPRDGRGLSPTDLNRVAAGSPAPDFTLPTANRQPLALSDLRGKNVVLVFYRGHW